MFEELKLNIFQLVFAEFIVCSLTLSLSPEEDKMVQLAKPERTNGLHFATHRNRKQRRLFRIQPRHRTTHGSPATATATATASATSPPPLPPLLLLPRLPPHRLLPPRFPLRVFLLRCAFLLAQPRPPRIPSLRILLSPKARPALKLPLFWAQHSQPPRPVGFPFCVVPYSNGDVYERELMGSKCCGSGVYYYSMSGRYEGDWMDGRYDEFGVETWAPGSRYRAQYRQGLRHGFGVYRFYTGDVYAGEWASGQSHGCGVHTCDDGSRFSFVMYGLTMGIMLLSQLTSSMEINKVEFNIEIKEKKQSVSMKSHKHEVNQIALNRWPETDILLVQTSKAAEMEIPLLFESIPLLYEKPHSYVADY
ncbi:hypothetical protein VNO78_20372 [Psophocarpus tetragonolobus]|uniref:Uncharacterized protein n=1 Tax=Psophocarpus tetragonolobus TaxID=3891 RepID=A0AAN9S952_PSOTE